MMAMTAESHAGDRSESKLRIAIIITLSVLILEVAGYILSNSLALLSDSAHVFLDVAALGLSYWAIRLACRPACGEATYGHHRAEILVAMVNAAAIFVLSFFIFREAYLRLLSPPPIKSFEMMTIALVGLIGNLAIVYILKGPKDLNVRSAYLHVIGDALSSIVIVCGGLVMLLTGNYLIDPVLSFLIGVIIIISAVRLLRESLDILMERVPRHIKLDRLRERLLTVRGVKDIHHLHAWSLCSHMHALSAHVVVDEISVGRTKGLVDEMGALAKSEFDICHCTFQFECLPCASETCGQ